MGWCIGWETYFCNTKVKVVDTVSGVTNTFSFAANQGITFHDNGAVYGGILTSNTAVTVVVGGVTNPFSFAANRTIIFHANGVVSGGAPTTNTKVKVVDTRQDPDVTNTFSF